MPFTYMSNAQAAAVFEVVGCALVYLPSSRQIPDAMLSLNKANTIDFRYHHTPDDAQLARRIQAYHEWANLHRGKKGIKTDYFSSMGGKTPFFDDTSSANIKAEIKPSGSPPGVDPSERQFRDALLFLALAQDFDIKNDELRTDLISLTNIERELISELKGEPEVFFEDTNILVQEDTGARMTAGRLQNWAHLYLENVELPAYFVTTSRAVCEQIVEESGNLQSVFEKMDKEHLAKFACDKQVAGLSEVVADLGKRTDPVAAFGGIPSRETSLPEETKTGAAISLWVVPGTSPVHFWEGYAMKGTAPMVQQHTSPDHTFVCLVEIGP